LPASAREPDSYALQLAAALRAGRAFVSNGPTLELSVGQQRPGDTVLLARGQTRVQVRVRIDAPAWMDLQSVELWLDGRLAKVQALAALGAPQKLPRQARAEWNVSVPVGKARSILAVVRGTRPMDELFDRRDVLPFAFTNPVWLSRH
jgi:hypothetical protein